MTEETWHRARIIPTSGIGGAAEQERRATSALMAVVSVVPDFGKALLGPLGPVESPPEITSTDISSQDGPDETASGGK